MAPKKSGVGPSSTKKRKGKEIEEAPLKIPSDRLRLPDSKRRFENIKNKDVTVEHVYDEKFLGNTILNPIPFLRTEFHDLTSLLDMPKTFGIDYYCPILIKEFYANLVANAFQCKFTTHVKNVEISFTWSELSGLLGDNGSYQGDEKITSFVKLRDRNFLLRMDPNDTKPVEHHIAVGELPILHRFIHSIVNLILVPHHAGTSKVSHEEMWLTCKILRREPFNFPMVFIRSIASADSKGKNPTHALLITHLIKNAGVPILDREKVKFSPLFHTIGEGYCKKLKMDTDDDGDLMWYDPNDPAALVGPVQPYDIVKLYGRNSVQREVSSDESSDEEEEEETENQESYENVGFEVYTGMVEQREEWSAKYDDLSRRVSTVDSEVGLIKEEFRGFQGRITEQLNRHERHLEKNTGLLKRILRKLGCGSSSDEDVIPSTSHIP